MHQETETANSWYKIGGTGIAADVKAFLENVEAKHQPSFTYYHQSVCWILFESYMGNLNTELLRLRILEYLENGCWIICFRKYISGQEILPYTHVFEALKKIKGSKKSTNGTL